jgi:FkbM family methyltransferase
MKIQIRNISFEVTDGQYYEVWNYINSGKWEPQTFKILDHFIGSKDTVLDLGAWIGAVSLYAAHPASQVYAIEPDPVVFPVLEKNVLLNPGLKSKIKCYKIALSDNNQPNTLYARNQYGSSSSSLLPRIRDGLSAEQVQGITLKRFIEYEKIKKIDFIKMDIEGGEFDLIPSIAADLKTLDYPTLYISFHYNYLTENQYYRKVKWKLISLFLMKLENWSGMELFGKMNRRMVLNCIQTLEDYKFIYTETAQEISRSDLKSHPSIIKSHNLVFTNKKWMQD